MVNIGDIYIPTVEDVNAKHGVTRDQIIDAINLENPQFFSGKKRTVGTFEMTGYLYQETGTSKTAQDYAEDLMALLERDAAYNLFNYDSEKGFVTDIDVSIPKDVGKKTIAKYVLKGRYFPSTVYQQGLSVEGDTYTNSVGIGFPQYVALPNGSTNVRMTSSLDIVNLSPVGYINSGLSAFIPIYRLYSLFNHSNYDSTTGSAGSDVDGYDTVTVELNAQNENIVWSFNAGTDVPRGSYKLKMRLKDGAITSDVKVLVVGSVSGTIATTYLTGSSSFSILETAALSLTTHEDITVTISKATADANTIVFDYVYLAPQFASMVVFDADSEYDKGEVKVYDTVTHGEATETNWKRVYSLRHQFTGDIILRNQLLTWRINTAALWSATGTLTVGGVAKALRPEAFGATYPSVRFISIEPMCVKMQITARQGTVGVGADDGVMDATVKLDPMMLRVEMKKSGGYTSDWKFTSSGVQYHGTSLSVSLDGDYTLITSSESEYMFCIVAPTGYTTITYHDLLFAAFNKPTTRRYISQKTI